MDPQEMKDTTRRWLQGIFDHGDYRLIPEMTTEDYYDRMAWLYGGTGLNATASAVA